MCINRTAVMKCRRLVSLRYYARTRTRRPRLSRSRWHTYTHLGTVSSVVRLREVVRSLTFETDGQSGCVCTNPTQPDDYDDGERAVGVFGVTQISGQTRMTGKQ